MFAASEQLQYLTVGAVFCKGVSDSCLRVSMWLESTLPDPGVAPSGRQKEPCRDIFCLPLCSLHAER